MKGVKGWWIGGLSLLLLTGLGFGVPKHLNPGIYYFSEKIDQTPIADLDYYWQRDTASSLAPKDVKIDLKLSDAKKIVYSFVELGNAKEKIHYVATINDKGNWDSLFVDSDQNGVITAKEKTPLHFQNEMDGYKLRMNADPIRVLVGYKNTAGNSIHKYLSFDILMQHHPASGQVIVLHRTRSWFVGEGRFAEGKSNEIPVKIALVDLNSDGIFGDFAQDGLFVDANYNGIFENKEKAKFSALVDIAAADKTKVQYRNYIFSWPYCLAVVPVKQWVDSAKYEPSDDAEPKKKEELPKVENGIDLIDINSIIR